MTRLLSWIIMLPLALVVIAFSVSNRGNVLLELWPLPFTFELPLFVAVLGGTVLGFFAGGLIAWISNSATRSRARAMTHRAEAAESEAARLKDKLADLETEAAAARNPALPAPGKAQAA